MKTLKNLLKIGIALGILSFSGCATLNEIRQQQSYLTQHGIPKEYYNYRKKAKNVTENVGVVGNNLVIFKGYDLDGDGQEDVGEIYLSGQPYPYIYGFDYNKNGKYDNNETLTDIKQDGLNGNEIRLDKYLENEKSFI